MTWRTAWLAFLLLATQRCASSESPAYVVLVIDDPLAVAADADALELSGPSGPIRSFERGELAYPITLTLTAEPTSSWALAVAASRAGTVIARCAVEVSFERDRAAEVPCALESYCDPQSCPPPPICTSNADCGDPPVCAPDNACSPLYCAEDGSCKPEVPRLTALGQSAGTLMPNPVVSLPIFGIAFSPSAEVTFDDNVVPVTTRTAGQIDATLTLTAARLGYHEVRVRNSGPFSRSNRAWFVAVPDSGMVLEDMNPDFGKPGEVVRAIGSSFDDTFNIIDGVGHAMACADTSDISWPTQFGKMSAECTIGAGFRSDLIVASDGDGFIYGRRFTVGDNRSLEPGVAVTASSTFGGYPPSAIVDGDLATSWFASDETCGGEPRCAWVEIVLDAPRDVSRVAIRGTRTTPDGYDVLVGELQLFTSNGLLLTRTLVTDRPFGDATTDFPLELQSITRVRFTVLVAEHAAPGIAEIEVFSNVNGARWDD